MARTADPQKELIWKTHIKQEKYLVLPGFLCPRLGIADASRSRRVLQFDSSRSFEILLHWL